MYYEIIYSVAGLAYIELNCTALWKHNYKNVLVDEIIRNCELS